ncbi:MAG: DUF2182 domain-containing protein [Acidobacteria bacterium]|nr:DUF2182 domain-containing protein [Acidobacteriota bacterium]
MERHLTSTTTTWARPAVPIVAAGVAMVAAWAMLAASHTWMPHHLDVTAASLVAATLMWLAMVVAMMTPTVLPWVRTYARLVAPADAPSSAARYTVPFVSGYAAVWTMFSVVMAGLQIALASSGWLSGDHLGTRIGGAVLIGAGVFQFLPIKQACLSHCRNPLSYFLARWKDGPIGGFRLGLAHGGYCLGCCWALMVTGFTMGVMNLAWMAVVTLIVVGEQVLPFGAAFGRTAGAGLVAAGIWLLVI